MGSGIYTGVIAKIDSTTLNKAIEKADFPLKVLKLMLAECRFWPENDKNNFTSRVTDTKYYGL